MIGNKIEIEGATLYRQIKTHDSDTKIEDQCSDAQKNDGIVSNIEKAAASSKEALRAFSKPYRDTLKSPGPDLRADNDVRVDDSGQYRYSTDDIGELLLDMHFSGTVTVGSETSDYPIDVDSVFVKNGTLKFTGFSSIYESFLIYSNSAILDFTNAFVGFYVSQFCTFGNVIIRDSNLDFFNYHTAAAAEFNSEIEVYGDSKFTLAPECFVIIGSFKLIGTLYLKGAGRVTLLHEYSGNGTIKVAEITDLEDHNYITLVIANSLQRIPQLSVGNGAWVEFENCATSGVIDIDLSEKTSGTAGCVIAFSEAMDVGGTLHIRVSIRNFTDGVKFDFPHLKFAGATFLKAYYEGGKIYVLYTVNGSGVRDIIFDDVTGPDLYDGKELKVFDDGTGGTEIEACFLAGTMIKTPGGWRAVENLCPGDAVITFSGGREVETPLRWVGHGDATCRPELPDDLAGYPVRIAPNAIAPGVPSEEVRVTAEHRLFIDGGLIPARMLANGDSIAYVRDVPQYRFYHIETPSHNIVSASGLPTETYLDIGNRNCFDDGQGVVSLPNMQNSRLAAPIKTEASEVEPIFHRLAARAPMPGSHPSCPNPNHLTSDPDLRVMLPNGRQLRPFNSRGNVVIFNLPTHISEVTLLSRISRPCDVIGPFIDDRRELGVLVGSICVISQFKISDVSTHLTNATLPGWHALEGVPHRWTNGAGCILLSPEISISQAHNALHIEILQHGPYHLTEKRGEHAYFDKLAEIAS